MRLFHFPGSLNSRRAVMTALHLESDVEFVLCNLAKGEQRAATFLAKNPNGKVPVLEDGDFVLWESHAIMQYLAESAPERAESVYPREKKARADVNRWLFWSAHHYMPAVSVLNWELVVKPLMNAGPPDASAVQRGNTLVTDLSRVLNEHLRERDWLAQGRLTLADFAVSACLGNIEAAKLPVQDCPHVLRWFERVRALDAWQRAASV